MERKYKKISQYLEDSKPSFAMPKAYLNSLLHNSRDVIYCYNLQTKCYDFISDSIEALTGYTAQEIYEQGLSLFVQNLHPDDKSKLMKFQLGLQNKTIADSTVELEYRIRRKDGTFYWQNDVINIIRDESGNITAVTGAIRDITKQKEHEKELQASKERFEILSEASFECICIHDQGRVIDVNQNFLEMFGFDSVDEVKGIECYEFIPPEYHELVRQYISTGEKGPYEIFALKTNGTHFPIQVRAREFHWDGKMVRIAVFRDLTEQKQLEQQLKESERLYKELYQNAKAALYRTRIHDGKLLACNIKLAQIHGYNSAEECLQKHHGTNHFVDKNRRKQLLDTLYKNKRAENFEYQIRHPDGTKAWLSLTAEIFPEKGWIEGVVTDITPSKSLTPTEMKVLKILLAGKSNKEIAYGLDRSVRTIEDHRAHIMHKLDVDNVVEMTRKALECGIKPDGE